MELKSILMRGPFSEDDIRELIAALRVVEARHPQEHFYFTIPYELAGSMREVQEMIERVAPPMEGYARKYEVVPRETKKS